MISDTENKRVTQERAGDERQHQGLPVSGYTTQPQWKVDLVNHFKEHEELLLRELDKLKGTEQVEQRWLAIGKTQLEQAFMAINRSVFNPQRIPHLKGEE